MVNNEFEIRVLGPCRFDSPLPGPFFQTDEGGILEDASVPGDGGPTGARAVLQLAGPRRRIFFDPTAVHAGVVTCGGLCPGLNDVIRAITMVLWYRYGVRRITGFRYGYAGLARVAGCEPVALTPESVEDIHQDGGTILGTSRGPQDAGTMVDFLAEKGVNVLFTIGGDGTQRGARTIVEAAERRGYGLAVVGVPKTIDNDLCFTERTFGFQTAVSMSQTPLTCAHMEAKGAQNGIGLVKLMGRESGFVAAYATLASSDVNLVLVPEVPFAIERVLAFLEDRLSRKAHAVIVAAEGAGQDFVESSGTDASGNPKLGDIGAFLKQVLTRHFDSAGIPMSVKYMDPSYTIRSAPATAADSVFCFQLAENAVHAAMAGKTATVVSLWNGHFVHVPMHKTVESRKRIDPRGSLWQSVLENTGQPGDLV